MDISDLEKTIRKNAIDKLRTNIWERFQKVQGVEGLTGFYVIRKAIDAFVEVNTQIIGDRAVRGFMTAYEKLIVEYPEIREDRDNLQSELMT